MFRYKSSKIRHKTESLRHSQLLAEYVKKKNNSNYLNWDENKKIKYLISEMNKNRKSFKNFNFKNKENNEVWSTFKLLADEPSECLGAYVISMTSAASDVLAVYLMQMQANIKNKLRVVPLFETLQDLKNAKSIMEKLFSLSWYRKLIQKQTRNYDWLFRF